MFKPISSHGKLQVVNSKFKKLTEYVLLICIFLLTCISLLQIYPHYVISSMGIILVCYYIILKYSIISVPSILSGALYMPALTPFYSHTLLNSQYYSYNNFFLQENLLLVNKATSILFFSSIVYLFFLIIITKSHILVSYNKRRTNLQNNVKAKLQIGETTTFYPSKEQVIMFCFLFLFFFWLTEPGSILLFINYTEVLASRYDDTQFASALGSIFFVLAFVSYINLSKSGLHKNIQKLFIISSILVSIWLLLHARRSELLGIFIIALLYLNEKISHKKMLIISIILFSVLIIVGNVRTTAFLDISQSLFIESMTFGDIVALPGGASNIFVTMLDIIYLIDDTNFQLLLGETYFDYFYSIIPTNLRIYLGLPEPIYFYSIFIQYFDYNGGTYIFAPGYGNFGVAGVFIVAGFIGTIVAFFHNNLNSKSFIIKTIVLIGILFFVRAIWYDLITILKPIFLMWFITYFYFLLQKRIVA